MAFAFIRTEKVKSTSMMATIQRHNQDREKLTRRVHPELEHLNREYQALCYDENSTYTERFHQRTEGIKYRKDAVLAIEVVVAYSPEAAGTFNFNDWERSNLEFMATYFGNNIDNIISASVHFDETTPHIHYLIVPRVGDRLCCKEFLGGKQKLSKLQTAYAKKMSQFGLERGSCFLDDPENKTRKHTELKDFYKEQSKEDRFIVDYGRY